MGVGNREHKNYLSISDGKILMKTDTPTEASVQKGKNFYNKHDFVEGIITGFGTRQKEYEKIPYLEQYINIQDGGESFQLQFRVASAFFRALCQQIRNVDLSKPVAFQPQEKIEGDKKNRMLWLSQNGESVGFYYKKDDMKDCPPVIEKKTKEGGIEKTVYDSEAQTDFFLNMLNTELNSQLSTPAAAAVTGTQTDSEFVDNGPEGDGDLPF